MVNAQRCGCALVCHRGSLGGRLVDLDIVELIPESSQVSQVTAAKILQKTISFRGAQQGFQDKPKTGSQFGVEAE